MSAQSNVVMPAETNASMSASAASTSTRAVAARELPAALEQPRDGVARREIDAGDRPSSLSAAGSAAARR